MIIGMWEYLGDRHDLAGTDTVSGIFIAFMGGVWWGFSPEAVLVDWQMEIWYLL
jgi:hypothetical protein